jgi:hypothetical protein
LRRTSSASTSLKLDIGDRRVWQLTIQGLPVLDTPAQEFRPLNRPGFSGGRFV